MIRCAHCQLRESQTQMKIRNRMTPLCNLCYKTFLNLGRAPIDIKVELSSDTKEEKRGEK